MIESSLSRPWTRRLALLGAIGAFALLGTATVPAAPPRAPRPDSGPPAARSPGAIALAALEAQLGRGAVGDGPGALAIARDFQLECEPGACSVVVKVVPTTPRRIVMLIQTNTLREMPDVQRRATLREIRVILDEEHLASDAEIAVGLKGRVFYGAVGFRTRTTRWRTDVGTVVSVAPIEALLAAPTLAAPLPPTR